MSRGIAGQIHLVGGVGIVDVWFSQGAKCYSADFLAYDIACDKWYSLEGTVPRCEEYIGSPVFFELIELAREFLTERNVPVCQCIICLNNIQEEDHFLKTECLHFFHKHCLGRYITSSQRGFEDENRAGLFLPVRTIILVTINITDRKEVMVGRWEVMVDSMTWKNMDPGS